ncbi:MAG: hypothetical protein AAB472_02480 [Patescibacteria group bacterium]
MLRTVLLEKRLGETPLEALTAWKTANPEYQDIPASYAGRLDPMASGALLILLGDECRKQKEYTGLDKEYEIEVLLDVGSDTGDILGLTVEAGVITTPTDEQITGVLKREVGTSIVPYPVYSSKTVAGKPLFLYALEGTLNTITIPTHEETIYSIKLRSTAEVSSEHLRKQVEGLLKKVPTSEEPSKKLGANFRIDAVKESWNEVFSAPSRAYVVLALTVSCGSGTYMRSLASRIGEQLDTRALALSIHRTRVGLT